MSHEKGRPGKAANPENIARRRQEQDTTEDPVHVGPTLLDYLDTVAAQVAEGERRKQAGMQAAEHGEAFGIRAAIEGEVRRLAATGDRFQPDDVLPNLESRRALGPVFRRLQREGVIVEVGTATSTRPSRHGALTRVYRGAGGGA